MISDAERTAHARRTLALFGERQAVQIAMLQGFAADEISRDLGIDEPGVARTIRLTKSWDLTHVTPTILILRAWVGEVSRDDLMGALRTWAPYTPTVYAPSPAEGAVAGSWAHIQHAFRDGYLTTEEYDSLRPLAPADKTAVR